MIWKRHLTLDELNATSQNTLMTRDGQCVVGTELNATHHRAVSQGKVRGVCLPLHLGRQNQSWEITLFDEQGRRCCTCRLGTAVMG
ncbi:hotdog fold thioesterase [Salmonella enterica]|nr:hotdog fold thioesterase [Salmonella enterica]